MRQKIRFSRAQRYKYLACILYITFGLSNQVTLHNMISKVNVRFPISKQISRHIIGTLNKQIERILGILVIENCWLYYLTYLKEKTFEEGLKFIQTF